MCLNKKVMNVPPACVCVVVRAHACRNGQEEAAEGRAADVCDVCVCSCVCVILCVCECGRM